ncbi:hypothetical protein F4827_005031 [Paraburkholderia bannensis]|uniref:Uncharacterized protein n=1 Tax=Paraburkholderia bannensis TaxID=765414 RepID=A0A7W9WTB5_9BURK|nr:MULTISPECIES: hypothetical protein [Paraburkholderia]MBB3259959.1 hypothetical protein [Paraburkholderia sp. WP4_3_2]MBB6105165.1 hypothetical protein [Paraburkholderia bannensis]
MNNTVDKATGAEAMTKDEYVKREFVVQFIEWMSTKLDDETFAHEYTMRRENLAWSCGSVFDAFQNYRWKHDGVNALGVPHGDTFESNATALGALREQLSSALAAGDDKRVCEAACAVMKWGGVTAGNVSWLTANESGLAARIASVRDTLDRNDTQHPLLTAPDLRFTSGMSKVYSLVCKEFVIYDSRVAAAIGWTIVKFCLAKKLESVPAELQFPWAPAKSSPNASNPPLRDPRQRQFDFLRLYSGVAYAKWNLQASWLLAEIAKRLVHGSGGFASIQPDADRLRALEAALFMIGYDLGGKESVSVKPDPVVADEVSDGGAGGGEWQEGFTPSRKVRFEYRIAASGIEVRDHEGFTDELVNATLTTLFALFSTTPFPLANGADSVRDGTARDGLGKCYRAAGGSNPPDTSKLAAILQEFEVFKRCYSPPAKGKHWTLNKDALGLEDGQANIRPWLDGYLKGE